MKRLVFALGLAVAATAVQAQTADDRVLHPSHENPSLTTALRTWLASKLAPNQASKSAPKTALTTTHAAEARRHAAAESHERNWHHAHRNKLSEADAAAKGAPKAVVMHVLPTPPAPAPSAAPTMTPASAPPAAPAAAATLASVNPDMPHAVATITVVAPSASRERPHHGRSGCTSGERIITAYYWEGKHTASGARFDPDGYTAAHRTFPFGTKLLVINPRNGKSVTVTVNDRGPFVRGVTLDISRGAARAIGVQGNAAVCMAKM